MFQSIESNSLNAWPPLKTIHYKGYIMTHSGGHSRRVNACIPLYSTPQIHVNDIVYIEHLYKTLDTLPIFKLSDQPIHNDLDLVLANRGYGLEGKTMVKTASISSLDNPNHTCIISTKLTDQWLETYLQMSHYQQKEVYRQIIRNIVPTTLYCSVIENGKIIGIGNSVIDNGYAGLFNIHVDPSFRRKGYGRSIVTTLLHESLKYGASNTYLQVESNNPNAIRLYDSLGYKTAYTYWYRKLYNKLKIE